MRKRLLLGFLLIGLSCSEPSINPKLTTLEQVANHLIALGHSVKIINVNNESSLLISTSLSRTDLAVEINKIFVLLAKPEQQFIVDSEDSISARTEGVSCSHSAFYDSGSARCTNWLCIADSSYSIVSDYDCYGNECFRMWTSCHEQQ